MRWSFKLIANNGAEVKFFNTLLFVSLMNNIAVPTLAIAFISNNCFYILLYGEKESHVYYVYHKCIASMRDQCAIQIPALAVTSYTPPFTYSFQCGAQYVRAYAPSFMYLALQVTFLEPLIRYILVKAYDSAKNYPKSPYWYIVEMCIPTHLRPLDASNVTHRFSSAYFDAMRYLNTILTYFCVLLTFGMVFPPLAVAMLGAMLSMVATNRVTMGRFFSNALELNAPQYLRFVEIENQLLALFLHKKQPLRFGISMILWTTCWFYTLFLFDILGDAEGTAKAAWMLLVMPVCVPLLLLTIVGVLDWRLLKSVQKYCSLASLVLYGSANSGHTCSDTSSVSCNPMDSAAKNISSKMNSNNGEVELLPIR
jgi:hypothetical protein